MTSREIVQRTVRFQKPPRLAANIGSLGVSDVAGIPVRAPESFKPEVPGQDEWGCVWEKTAVPNMGQVKGHPLADIRDLDRLPVPDYDCDSRYVDVPAALDRFEAAGKYITGGIFMVLFERMHSIHGFENVLTELVTDRPAMEALADRIADVHIGYVRNVARRFGNRVHAFGMTDDWGTQQAAFVSSDMWMDFFFPRYKRIFDAMHEAGYDVWVHSCGKVNEIVESYIRAGVDAVNLQQPRALGIEEMGQRFRGRITFESLADIQHTLPTNDRRKVAEDVEALMQHWATPEGGFVFSDYGDNAAIGVGDPDIKRYLYQRFSEYSERVYGEPLPEPVVPQGG